MREWDTSLFENGNKELSKKLFDKYFGHLINDGEHTSCCATECPTPVYTYHNCGALIQADGWQIKEDYPW